MSDDPKNTKNNPTSEQYISMLEASKLCSYSQEYLSLLARRGKIAATKIGRNWYVTRVALDEYLKQQSVIISLPKTFFANHSAPTELRTDKFGKPVLVSSLREDARPTPEVASGSKLYNEFLKLNAELKAAQNAPTPVQQNVSTQTITPVAPNVHSLAKEHPTNLHERVRDNKFSNTIDKLADSISQLSQKVATPTSAPLSPEQQEFINIESDSLGYRFRRIHHYYSNFPKHPQRLTALVVAAIALLFMLVGGFSFGNVDMVAQKVRKAFKDAESVQGHFPGTHANEVLVLDKTGKISIFGHIETQGQFRSFAPEGVAPIVVDSMTKVENLNADYFDNLDSQDFTLAFVTQNGNVTYEDVKLEGNVEIGKSLTLKGALKLQDSLNVYGKLGVFGDAIFGKEVKLTNGSLKIEKGNLQLGQGTIEINNTNLIKNLNAEYWNGKSQGDFTLDYVVGQGNSTSKVAFFNGGLFGGNGSFTTLGVKGTVGIGSPAEQSKTNFTVYADKFTVDESGNVSISGRTTTSLLQVNSGVKSDLIPSGSFNLGSATNPWEDLFVNDAIFSGGVTISGNFVLTGSNSLNTDSSFTSSESFRINSDNTTNDTEDSYLAFERGSTTPNAALMWNATLNRFEFNQPVVISSTSTTIFEVYGAASVSSLFGATLSSCAATQNLRWLNGKFTCVATQVGAGLSTLGVRESDDAINDVSVLSFEAGNFNISYPDPTEALVKLDWINGPASRAANEIITGFWRFNAASTQLTGLELMNNASIGGNIVVLGNETLSGTLLVAGHAHFNSNVSVSGNFETIGYASASATFGSGLTNCIGATTDKLLWNGTTGRFSCSSDNAAIRVEEGGSVIVAGATTFNFDAGKFSLTASGSEALVNLDWGNAGPASLSQDETVTGFWRFTAASTQLTGLELINNASIGGNVVVAGTGSSSFAGSLDIARGLRGLDITANGRLSVLGNTTLSGATNLSTLTASALAVFNGGASVTSNFEVFGYASVSQLFGATLSTCAITQNLQWLNGRFICVNTQTGSGFSTLGIRESGGAFSNRSSLSFEAGNFNVTFPSSTEALVKLDWVNGPASRAANETIIGNWRFTNSASISPNLEVIGGYASISNTLWVNKVVGNVGIGTANPGNRLDIVGPVQNGVYVVRIDATAEGQAGSQHGLTINGTAGSSTLISAGETTITRLPPYLRVDGAVNENYVATINNSGGTGYGLKIDAATYGLIVNTGAVGIGDASPEQKLTVAGNILASSSGNIDLVLRSSTTNGSLNSDAQFTLRTGSSSERFDIINGANLKLLSIASAGNVGIGTTNPQARLHVHGATGIQLTAPSGAVTTNIITTAGGVDIDQALAATSFLDYGNANNSFDLGTGNYQTLSGVITLTPGFSLGGGTFRINDDGTTTDATPFFIGGSGKVGVGTSLPLAKFEVQGTASASNLQTSGLLQVANGGATVSYSRFGIDNSTHSSDVASNDDLLISGDLEVNGKAYFDGGIVFSQPSSASGDFEVGGQVLLADGSAPAPSLTFKLDKDTGLYRIGNDVFGISTGGAERLRFSTSGTSGSFPIEATTFRATTYTGDGALSLLSGGANSLTIDTGGAATLTIAGANASVLQIGRSGLTTEFIDDIRVDGNDIKDSANVARISFTSTGLITLTGDIDGTKHIKSGDELIVTNALQVGGTATVAYSRFGTSATTHSNYISAANDLLINGDFEVDASAQFDSFLQVGTDTFYVNPTTGNIGIGTTSPTAKLNIFGTSATKVLLTSTTGSTPQIQFRSSNDDTLLYNPGDGFRVDVENASGALYINSATGNTGIGTLTPDQKLDVSGNILASASGNIDLTLHSTSETVAGQGSFTIRSAGASERLDFIAPGMTALTIASSGNVGIGTLTPGARLHVIGNASISTNFEVSGYASHSALFGLAYTVCNATTGKLLWSSSDGRFFCGVDQTTGGGSGGNMEVREYPGGFGGNVSTISFDPGHFQLAASGSNDVHIRLDWGSAGPASLSQNETVAGSWIFTAASTTFNNIEVSGTASTSGNLFVGGTSGASFTGAGAGLTFTNSGTHTIQATAGTLQFGAFTLGGLITGNNQNITGLDLLTTTNASASNNLEISNAASVGGNLLVRGRTDFLGNASIAGTFESSGIIKATTYTGDGAVTLRSNGGQSLALEAPSGALNIGVDANTSSITLSRAGLVTVFSDDIRVAGNDIQDSSAITRITIGPTVTIAANLSVTGGTLVAQNASVSGNFEVGTNKFYVDSTAGHVGIGTQNLSESLEIVGNASISGTLTAFQLHFTNASISNNLEVGNRASVSALVGSAFTGVSNCFDETQTLLWNSATGRFACGLDSGASGSNLSVREFPGSEFAGRATVSFEVGHFNVTASGTTDVSIKLDWTNGPASRAANETVTGFWRFTAASTQLAGLELINTASIGGNARIAGNASISRNLEVNESIILDKAAAGDATTLDLRVAGTSRIKLNPYDAGTASRITFNNSASIIENTGGSLILNTSGNDIEFRENNNTFAIFTGTQRFGIGDTTPETKFEVSGGDASISNTLYAQNGANVGIGTVDPQTKLEIAGTASASAYTGVAFSSISNCNLETQTLLWDSSTGTFSCGADAGAAGGNVRTEEGGTTIVQNSSVINFEAGHFSLTASNSSESIVRLDWTNGPASRAANETVTGFWRFTAASTQLAGLELINTASIGGNILFGGTGTHIIQAPTGTLQLGALTLTGLVTGNSQDILGVQNVSGSGTFEAPTVKATTFTGDGAVAVLSNGINTLRLDTGGSGTLNIGDANAAAINIGRSAVTTNIVDDLEISGGDIKDTTGQERITFVSNGSAGLTAFVGYASFSQDLEIAGRGTVNGALQVAGTIPAAYSRYGTGTTTHPGSITQANDLFITGDFEIDGSASFDGFALFSNASVSGTLEAAIALISNGVLQAGGSTNTTYNRLGTGTSNRGLSTNSDMLVSGKLEVTGDAWFNSHASVSGNLEVSGIISGFSISSNASISGNLDVTGFIHAGDGSAVFPTYTFDNDQDTGLFRPGSDLIGFTTGGAERMRLSATGLAIGAVNAEQKLEVGGNILASGSGDIELILRSTSSTGTQAQFTIRSVGLAPASESLQIFNGAGTSLVMFASNGNVGIGTTAVTAGTKVTISGGPLNISSGVSNNGQLWLGGSTVLEATSSPLTLTINGAGFTNVVFAQGYIGINDTTPDARFDVAGSGIFDNELMVSGALQVAHTATATYSRFGSATTGHSLAAASDVLISGLLEVDAATYLGFTASISNNLEVGGYASASATFGSGLTGCSNEATDKLLWNGTTGRFLCSIDGGGGGTGSGRMQIRELGFFDEPTAATISFDPGQFALAASEGNPGFNDVVVRLDWGAGGPASLSQDETVHGFWTFNNHASVASPFVFEVGGSIKSSLYTGDGAISVLSGGNNTLRLDAGGSGVVNIGDQNATAVNLGRTGISTTVLGSLTGPLATLTISGNASASGTFEAITNIIANNVIQAGGTTVVAYNRIGTSTTNHSTFINSNSDLLISGDLEVDGIANFDGIASASLFYASNGTAASPSFSFRADQDTGMFRPSVNQLGFSTLGIERIRINASGNVGIGDSSPEVFFTVAGNILASASGPTDIVLRSFGSTNPTTNDGKFTLRASASFGSDTLQILNGANTNLLTLASSGNIGIGAVTDPDLELTIANNDVTSNQIRLRSQRAAIVTGNIIGGMDFMSNDTQLTAPGITVAQIQAVAAGTHSTTVLTTDLTFTTTTGINFTEKMRLTGAGRLGVWDTSPDATLEINASSSDDVLNITSIGGSDGDYVTIENLGDVGIGITNPTAKFHIANIVPVTAVTTGTGTAAANIMTVSGSWGGNSNDLDGTAIGGVGSAILMTGGSGGIATFATVSNTGGAGGDFTFTGGRGGHATVVGTGTNTGGAGGAITIRGGTGGGANGGLVNNGGAGGLLTLSGGTAATATGSAGGAVAITGAAGSTTGTGGAGGALTLAAGAAGGDQTVNRQGGLISITTGVSVGNLAGGAFSVVGGAAGQNAADRDGTATGPAGGTFTLTMGAAGIAPNATISATGGSGGAFNITGGAGGAGSVAGSGTNTGGTGSAFAWTSGIGGAATGATSGNNLGGNGGGFTLTVGAGGAANNSTGNNTGGIAGTLSLTGGTGGAATTAGLINTGGAGSTFTWTAGTGGAANGGSTRNVGGAGGPITLRAGTGGIGTNLGGAGGLLTLQGGTAAVSSGSAGGGVTLTGAAGTTVASGGAGGALTLTAGAAGGTGVVARQGGAVSITAGASVGTLAGGAVTLTAGAGGANPATGTITGGAGGAFTITMAAGGTAASADIQSTGGAGGTFTINGGLGGTAAVAGTGINNGGAGSAMTWTGGAGGTATGATSGNNTGGNGGTLTFNTGAGGAANNSTNQNRGGNGGAYNTSLGIGGAATTAALTNIGGNGGAYTLTAGTGGAASAGTVTNTGGNGGAFTITAGTAGAGTGAGVGATGGSGGLLTLNGGAAAAASASAGGGITLAAGVGSNTGNGGAGGALIFTAGAGRGNNTVARAGGAITLTAGASAGPQAGGAFTFVAGLAGTSLVTGTVVAPAGGGYTFTPGAGGTATGADVSSTGGAAGGYTIVAATGGAASVAGTGTNTGGAGSLFSVATGIGGAATGATSGINLGGAGGALTFTTGAGGAANTSTGINTGGAAGAFTFTGGTGGATTTAGTTNTGGAGALITLTAGTGGAATGATTNIAGAGGAVTITAGTGGAGSTAKTGVGGNLTLNGGIAGTAAGGGTQSGGGHIIFQTAATVTRTEAMRITSGSFVGIGTAAPISKLDLSDANGAIMTMSRNDTSVTTNDLIGKFQFWNNDASLTTQNIFASIEAYAATTTTTDAAAAYLSFKTTSDAVGSSPVERMRISHTGYVGIGTNGNPTTRFQVQGTASVSYLIVANALNAARPGNVASTAYSRFGIATTTHPNSLSTADDLLISGDLEVDGSVFFDGTLNTIGIASASAFYAGNGTAASPSFSFRADQDGGMFRPAANQLGFSTLGIERIRINASGNVGISDSSPEQTLSIGGSIQASASGPIDLILRSTPFANLTNNDAKFTIRSSAGTGFDILQILNGANTSLVTVASLGNFGIGATTPDQKLEVAGNILASTSGNILLTLKSTTTSDSLYTLKIGSSSAQFDILGSASQQLFTIASSSNVKFTNNINYSTTINPSTVNLKLFSNLNQSTNVGPVLGFSGFDNAGTNEALWAAIKGAKENSTNGNSNGYLSFLVNGNAFNISEQMRLTSDGRLGIGTTTPDAKLDVVGNIVASTSGNVSLTLNSSTEDDAKFTIQTTATAGSVARLDILGSASQIFVSLASSGRMALGESTVSSFVGKLHLEGSVITSGATAVGGYFASISLSNSTGSGFQYGNRFLNNVVGGTAGTSVGHFIRMTDNTALSNTVRGLEVQAFSGTNTAGINTGIAAFGKTFGIQGTTDALAGGVATPAGVFADLDNGSAPTAGNALRAYTDNATSANLVQLYQEVSAFRGTGLLMNFGNNGGSYFGRYLDLQKAGLSQFSIVSTTSAGIAAKIGVGTLVGYRVDTVSSTSLIIEGTSTNTSFGYPELALGRDATAGTGAAGVISFYNTGLSTTDKRLAAIVGLSEASNIASGQISIWTTKSLGNLQERLRIGATGSTSLTFTKSSGAIAVCHESNTLNALEELVDCATGAGADYMEMYPMALEVEEGDIVVANPNSHVITNDGDKLSQVSLTSKPYDENIIGIVSNANNATDFNSIGRNLNETSNPQPLALSGRVKVKVSLENGPIKVGDKLTTSSVAGIAMKATEAGMSVGMALEDLPVDSMASGSYSKIMTFVQVGYWAPSSSNIAIAPSSVITNTSSGSVTVESASEIDIFTTIANAAEIIMKKIRVTGDIVAQGMKKTYFAFADALPNIDPSTWVSRPTTISVTAPEEMKALFSGTSAQAADQSKIDLIEDNGNYLATYGVDSTRGEIQLSGTSALINGEAKVYFDESFSSIISDTTQIRVLITPISDSVRGQIYVATKNQFGFIAKELNGLSNGKFDWLVIARRKGFDSDLTPTPSPVSSTLPSPSSEPSPTPSPTEDTTSEELESPSPTSETSSIPSPTPEATSTSTPVPSESIAPSPEPTPAQ